MCTKRSFLVCLLLVLFVYVVPAQANLQEELTKTSSTINGMLLNLKVQSSNMKEQLETVSENLKASEAELSLWKQQSMDLSRSLDSINNSLTHSYTIITNYENKIATQYKILVVLLIIIVARLLTMIIGYILMFKGVKVPRWMDILL